MKNIALLGEGVLRLESYFQGIVIPKIGMQNFRDFHIDFILVDDISIHSKIAPPSFSFIALDPNEGTVLGVCHNLSIANDGREELQIAEKILGNRKGQKPQNE